MKPITNDIKNKILMYNKNGLDISPLIEDVELKGVDLSNSIINKLYRIDANLQGAKFAGCSLGEPESTSITFVRCNLDDVSFKGAKFVGNAWLRSCSAKRVDLRYCDWSKVDYKYSDFRGANFCESILKFGAQSGLGCKFSKDIFYSLSKVWDMKVTVEDREEGTV